MSCSCRAAPWRAFVQGLAQVHRADSQSTASIFRQQPHAARTVLPTWSAWDTARQLRNLHVTPCRAQDEVAAAANVEKDKQSSATVSEANEPRTDTPAEDSTREAREALPTESDSQESSDASTKQSRAPRQANEDVVDAEETGRPKKQRWSDEKKKEHKEKKEAKEHRKEQRQQRKEAAPPTSSSSRPQPQDPGYLPPKEPDWLIQKRMLKEKFPEGWNPRKRLSPDALAGIRALNAQFPEVYTTTALASKFEVSPEVVRRILKSKWQPTVEEEQDRQDRWVRRGKQVWERKAALGIKPPKRWREMGVARDPDFHEWSRRAKERDQAWEESEKEEYRARIEERRQQREGGGSQSGRPEYSEQRESSGNALFRRPDYSGRRDGGSQSKWSEGSERKPRAWQSRSADSESMPAGRQSRPPRRDD